MEEQIFEPPPKQRRLLDSHSQHHELRELVHRLTKVPLSDFYRKSTVQTVWLHFARFADLLRQSSFQGNDDRFLLAQVHGMLLQWLDFIVTQQPPRDITTQDESGIVKVTLSAVQICRCLKEVYRCSPNLYQFEGLLILVRAFLTTTQQTSTNVQTPLPILHTVRDVTLQTDADQLPTSLKQRFVLALLDLSSSRDEDSKLTKTSDCDKSEVLNTDCGSASTMNLTILSHLAGTKLTSDSDCISKLAQIALLSFSEDHPSVGDAAMNSGGDLFRLQCLFRLPAFQPDVDVMMVTLKTLMNTALTIRGEATRRFQAMDCMVTLSGRCAQLDPKPTLTVSLISSLLEILSSSGASTVDHIVKFQAVDGLRLLLDGDETLNDCVEALYGQEDNSKTRRFLSSLVEVACSSRKRYYQGLVDEHGLLHYVLCHHVDNAVETASAEIVLSILRIVCTDATDNNDDDERHKKTRRTLISSTDVAAICHSFLRQGSEHLVYLTVRTMYRHGPAFFFDVTEMHPELLSSLAEVLGSSSRHSSIPPVTYERILRFLVDVLQARPLLMPVVARQPGVVDAIAQVLAATTTAAATTNVIRPLAASLLFELSSNVCNRLLLARTHRVLAGMIQYAREVRHDDPQIVANGETATTLPVCHRQVMKERIAQLAQVL